MTFHELLDAEFRQCSMSSSKTVAIKFVGEDVPNEPFASKLDNLNIIL